MHESTLANWVIAELRGKQFREAYLEVGALSIHGTQESLEHFLGHVREAFPGKKIEATMLRPTLRCKTCGFEKAQLQGDIKCPKCGDSMGIDLHEGCRIAKLV